MHPYMHSLIDPLTHAWMHAFTQHTCQDGFGTHQEISTHKRSQPPPCKLVKSSFHLTQLPSKTGFVRHTLSNICGIDAYYSIDYTSVDLP